MKVLAENWTEDSHVRQRFIEEGRFLRKVESPHVVTVYDAGLLDDDRPYLVMSYADQGTLADRMEAEGFTVPQAVEVIRQVGEGLHALHLRGVLHRDMKPANVLFRTVDPEHSGTAVRAMVGDLGLGKALDVSSRLTMIAGTPSYVAPEQAQGEHLDARADQFSLAALAFLHAQRPAAVRPRLALGRRQPGAPAAAVDPRAAVPAGRRGRRTTGARGRPRRAVARRAGLRDRPARVARRRAASAPCPSAGCRSTPTSPSPATSRRWPPPPATSRSRSPRGDRRRWPAAALALVLLVVGAVAGFAWWRSTTTRRAVRRGRRRPVGDRAERVGARGVPLRVGAARTRRSASRRCRSGDRQGWQTAGQGVFVGLLPEDRLPTTLPHHPGCDERRASPSASAPGADPSLTVTSTGCPGGSVIVERAVQVNAGTLLWVQVRSDDEQTAQDVLGSVRARGGL